MAGFDLTIGPMLLGILFNTYLYGLVCMQFLRYYTLGFDDPPRTRIMVALLFVIDTVNSAIGVYAAWDLCVKNFANPAVMNVIPWEISVTAAATSVVALISQTFLGHRAYCLTRSRILFAIIVALSIIACGGGVAVGVWSAILKQVSRFGAIEPVVIIWLVGQTTADLIITVVLTIALSRSRTGVARTNTVINRLIRGTIQTGFFASVFALGDLFSYLLRRETTLYAMFNYPIGRIYTNTLLDTLNSRKNLQEAMSDVVDLDDQSFGGSRTIGSRRKPAISVIAVETQREVHSDSVDIAARTHAAGSPNKLRGLWSSQSDLKMFGASKGRDVSVSPTTD